ncbi:hypothetical protein HZH68_013288 [Vespula germanica]|uniref:Uncharacterized protein n=1 Tax=Vespula germanica TaxID=30212 RepID=A0A834JEG0_VESGE|nr:hypothetical protein HZH68_013288 [Vespula germanica]
MTSQRHHSGIKLCRCRVDCSLAFLFRNLMLALESCNESCSHFRRVVCDIVNLIVALVDEGWRYCVRKVVDVFTGYNEEEEKEEKEKEEEEEEEKEKEETEEWATMEPKLPSSWNSRERGGVMEGRKDRSFYYQSEEGHSKMDIRITLLCLFLFCVVPRSTVGKSRFTNPDLFYFPDQADYLKRANKCPDNMILWLGNGRCYKEGERGPCNVGRVLVIDERLFKPYCKDILQ